MSKLKHFGPTLVVVGLPALLLIFRSMSILRSVWCGAIAGLAYLAGEELACVVPKSAMIGVAVVSVLGVVAAIVFGWLEFGVSLPVDFGNLAVIAVGVGIPAKAVVVQFRQATT